MSRLLRQISSVTLAWSIASTALAQEPATDSAEPTVAPQMPTGPAVEPRTDRYLELLRGAGVWSPREPSADEAEDRLARAELLLGAGRPADAALALDVLLSDVSGTDALSRGERSRARLLLGDALGQIGAIASARRELLAVIGEGKGNPNDASEEARNRRFAAALARYVELGVGTTDPDEALEVLESTSLAGRNFAQLDLDPGEAGELAYLRAHALLAADATDRAEVELATISAVSRHHADAQYLRGLIATRAGEFDAAEGHFCAARGDDEQLVSTARGRRSSLADLAHLALGRLAHAGERADDAYYYYFQVPADSARMGEALFESAFAMYEASEYAVAEDLLRELRLRFRGNSFRIEAELLSGYLALGRCEFGLASDRFVRFERRYTPVRELIDRLLGDEALRAAFVRDVEQGVSGEGPWDRALASVRDRLRDDAGYHTLLEREHRLLAESARAGWLATDFGALLSRARSGDVPTAPIALQRWLAHAAELAERYEAVAAGVAGLRRELARLELAGAPATELAPLVAELASERATLAALRVRIDAALATELAAIPATTFGTTTLDAMLQNEEREVRALATESHALLVRLRALRARYVSGRLTEFGAELATQLRRARIGRIDAVMGSQRRVAIQIETLAAGEFPAELVDPVRMEGLLRDDEEYWPYEGEYWADEFHSTLAPEEAE